MEATALPAGAGASRAAAVLSSRHEPADDDLVLQARSGATAALEELTRRYRGRIYVFAFSLLQRPEDAEDAAQETFVRAVRSLPGYEPRGHFRTWLFAIAANVCRAHQRRERRRGAVAAGAPEQLEGALVEGGPDCLREGLREAVRRAIDRLPSTYRAPVVLYYLEELSVGEIAAVLRRSRAAVKVQLWRARSFLARDLAEWLD